MQLTGDLIYKHVCIAVSLIRNKDGFLTRGEIKLTNKNASMKDVQEVR